MAGGEDSHHDAGNRAPPGPGTSPQTQIPLEGALAKPHLGDEPCSDTAWHKGAALSLLTPSTTTRGCISGRSEPCCRHTVTALAPQGTAAPPASRASRGWQRAGAARRLAGWHAAEPGLPCDARGCHGDGGFSGKDAEIGSAPPRRAAGAARLPSPGARVWAAQPRVSGPCRSAEPRWQRSP